MNEQATGSQAVASALENVKLNMSLAEFEQLLEGAVAAPEGERPDDWIALVAPAADAETKRRLAAAHEVRARDVKRQASQPVTARIAALQKELATQKLDGFLVPRADEHQGEYVPKRAERLAWISNFTGSAGLAIVLKDKAAIFVDGRYTIQVREQVDAQLFEIRHLINEPPEAWIAANLKKGEVLGFDPWLTTADAAQRYREAARKAGAELKAVDCNPLDAAWADQPPEPIAPIWPQDTRHAGQSSGDKRQLIARKLRERGLGAAVISAPDSLAWLLNIRGGDVPRTPFALGYAIIDRDGRVDLFTDPRKLTAEARHHLGNEVAVQPKSGFLPALDARELPGRSSLHAVEVGHGRGRRRPRGRQIGEPLHDLAPPAGVEHGFVQEPGGRNRRHRPREPLQRRVEPGGGGGVQVGGIGPQPLGDLRPREERRGLLPRWLGELDLAGRGVGQAHAERPVGGPEGGEEVVGRGLEEPLAHDRPGGEHLRHPALHQAACQGRVLQLVADRHLVPGLEEPGHVGVPLVPGDAAHRDRLGILLVAGGEREPEHRRPAHRVLEERLVEVAEPEEQDRFRIPLLGAEKLPHHGRVAPGFLLAGSRRPHGTEPTSFPLGAGGHS